MVVGSTTQAGRALRAAWSHSVTAMGGVVTHSHHRRRQDEADHQRRQAQHEVWCSHSTPVLTNLAVGDIG